MIDIDELRRMENGLQAAESDIRMVFNEALSCGINGDGGAIIHTEGHALDLLDAAQCIMELRAEIAGLRNRVDHLEDIIHQCKNWCGAYPDDIFLEPDLNTVKAILDSNGMLVQMDRMHASWGRRILSGLAKILDQSN